MGRLWLVLVWTWICGSCTSDPPPAPDKPLEKPGFVTVSGRLVDADGAAVVQLDDVYAPELAPFLGRHAGKAARLHVADVTGKGPMKQRDTIVTEDGKFETKLEPDSQILFRLDFAGAHLRPQQIHVGLQDFELPIRVERSRHILYGEIRDAKSGERITEHVTLEGKQAHASTLEGTYAIFLEQPAELELEVRARDGLHQTIVSTVNVASPDTRHDIVLPRLEDAPGALALRLHIEGLEPTAADQVWVTLAGPGDFATRRHVDNAAIEIAVPGPGAYQLSAIGPTVHLELPATVTMDADTDLPVKARRKDTRLLVTVRKPNSKPMGFKLSKDATPHDPRTNCVAIERAGSTDDPFGKKRFLQAGPGDAGSAIRPSRKGEVEFMLADGGTYELHTHFDGYKPRTVTVEAPAHKTTTLNITLER